MTTEAPAGPDDTSRRTVLRFAIKLVFAMLAAYAVASERPYAEALAAWLAFYAFFAALAGLFFGQKLKATAFTYWDETLWLLLAAGLARTLGRLIA